MKSTVRWQSPQLLLQPTWRSYLTPDWSTTLARDCGHGNLSVLFQSTCQTSQHCRSTRLLFTKKSKYKEHLPAISRLPFVHVNARENLLINSLQKVEERDTCRSANSQSILKAENRWIRFQIASQYYYVRRCGLLLQLDGVTWSVGMSVCQSVTIMSPAKTAEGTVY